MRGSRKINNRKTSRLISHFLSNFLSVSWEKLKLGQLQIKRFEIKLKLVTLRGLKIVSDFERKKKKKQKAMSTIKKYLTRRQRFGKLTSRRIMLNVCWRHWSWRLFASLWVFGFAQFFSNVFLKSFKVFLYFWGLFRVFFTWGEKDKTAKKMFCVFSRERNRENFVECI